MGCDEHDGACVPSSVYSDAMFALHLSLYRSFCGSVSESNRYALRSNVTDGFIEFCVHAITVDMCLGESDEHQAFLEFRGLVAGFRQKYMEVANVDFESEDR